MARWPRGEAGGVQPVARWFESGPCLLKERRGIVVNDGMRFLIAQRVRRELNKLSVWQKRLIQLGRKHYLRHERWSGWTGNLPVYLFWCGICGHFTLDYPHGYIQGRYLTCQNCGTHTSFVPWWIPFVKLWEFLKIAWRYR